jgi:hypothetical protein
MTQPAHELILLLGRPASGKSEIVDFLQRTQPAERLRRFRVGDLVVLDDFPMLWAWFEEDAILEAMGRPRLHTTADNSFLGNHLWEVLVRRLGLEYEKLLKGRPPGGQPLTTIIEFSRGTEHGGYREALPQLPDLVLDRAAALYVRVSFEESLRKNRKRFNPDRPHSILEHGLSDEKLERLYSRDDWDDVPRADGSRPAGGPTDHLLVRGRALPAVVFENEDDVTTPRGDALGRRLEEALDRLWQLRSHAASLQFLIDGAAVFTSVGKWLHPLFDLERFVKEHGIDASRGEIRDKVVGRGSALLIVRLGVRKVHAGLLSRLGKDVLDRAGVVVTWDTLVDQVACATEGILSEVTDLEEAYRILADRAQKGR